MNIALDTNIIVYVLAGVAQTALRASRALDDAASRGGVIVVSAPVYAELLAIPNSSKRDLDTFMAETRIRVDWNLSENCWTAAGVAFAAYARRRNKQRLDSPRRILADFIIGAHAVEVGNLLNRGPCLLPDELSGAERRRALRAAA
jgi:predicted nucleic acid-binding protein